MPAEPRLDRRQLRRLIAAAYAVAFPYVLLFIGIMLIVLWLLTEVIFR